MANVIPLLFLTLVAVTVSAKPTTEYELLTELKRILQEERANRGLGTAGDAHGQIDDDEEERVREEEITKGLEQEAGKEKDEEILEIEGGELLETGEQNPGTGTELENAEQNQGVEGELENAAEGNPDEGVAENTEQNPEEEELENAGEENPEEPEVPGVQGLLHQGWDMLDDLQRVSVALYMEKHPISENKSPRDGLHDVLVQMFEFDGLTDKVISNLFRRLSPSTDMCSEMFSEDEERTLERVTNCFIMRFTQVLSLVERLEKVSSISELKGEDLIRLSTLERDLFRVSYEVFKILKKEDPSVSLPDIIGDKQAALLAMQEGDISLSGANPEGSQAQPAPGNPNEEEEEGGEGNVEGEGEGEEEEGEEEEGQGKEEGESIGNEEEGNEEEGNGNGEGNGNEVEAGGGDEDTPAVGSSKRFWKKDFISRLAKKLEDLVAGNIES